MTANNSLGEWNWPADVTDQTLKTCIMLQRLCRVFCPAIQVNQTCIRWHQSVNFTAPSCISNKILFGHFHPVVWKLARWFHPQDNDRRMTMSWPEGRILGSQLIVAMVTYHIASFKQELTTKACPGKSKHTKRKSKKYLFGFCFWSVLCLTDVKMLSLHTTQKCTALYSLHTEHILPLGVIASNWRGGRNQCDGLSTLGVLKVQTDCSKKKRRSKDPHLETNAVSVPLFNVTSFDGIFQVWAMFSSQFLPPLTLLASLMSLWNVSWAPRSTV